MGSSAGRALPAREEGATVGVDVGGTKILGVVLAADGTVMAQARLPTPAPRPQERGRRVPGSLGAEVARTIDVLVEQLGGQDLAVGVGAPGMVDVSGRIRFAPNLPGLDGVDLAAVGGSTVNSSTVGPKAATLMTVGNDATCAARAEHLLGAGRGVEDLVMVTLGTGIGGGLVSGGRVVTGGSGLAGEIGHTVVDPNGPPCPCGGRGCWERYASGGGLGRLAREAAAAGLIPEVVVLAGGDPEGVRGEHVTLAARRGDEGAQRLLEQVGWWLALGLANLVAVLDPRRIVIGGGLSEAGEALLTPARRALAGLVEGGPARPPVEVAAARFGESAGAVGAALMARTAGRGVER